ncbi:HAD-like domain-containing protein [Aspergillus bertholletiae]|uniref:HAD-like domain-containing protein n=1 Tax=Aspergillus bertholletiae TaxID=1226010 RepID=A0A5N7BBA1_9EURO|nr:HAD-like domain-containing protein [Aspergillus bertholletiae]
MTRQCQAIILDLGNVVFEWDVSKNPTTANQISLLRSSMKSPIYHSYERGQLSTEECHRALGESLHVNPSEIKEAFDLARQSLRSNRALLDFIRQLKQTHRVAVYAMSNIPQSEIEYLKESKASDIEVFDGIFASGYVGSRKPETEIYRRVMREIGTSAERLVFVDDKEENVDVARGLGMYGLCFVGVEELRVHLQTHLFRVI